MHVQPILGEPTLLLAFEGWNDACESASAAVSFVNDVLRSVPLADIDPDDYYDFTVLRPEVQYQAGRSGSIVWPSNEFRYGVTEEGKELITGLGIEPHMRWRSYCDAVVELAVDMGVRRCLILGAYLADVVYSQPVVVTGFSSEPALLEKFEIEPTSYDGPTGIVGVLSNGLEEEGVEVLRIPAPSAAQAPHPVGNRYAPASVKVSSVPSAVASLITCCDAGAINNRVRGLTGRPCKISATICRSVNFAPTQAPM